MMQEVAQLGIDQDPSRAKRIKRLYAKAMRDQKKHVKTPPTRRDSWLQAEFWTIK